MKAFDYANALADVDPPRRMALLVNRFNAERELHDRCGERKLNRVVTALDAGTVRVPGTSPDAVSFLIFERADGDARDVISQLDLAQHAPMLGVAHNAAVAVSQLHGIGAAHQDIKPSNLLIWAPQANPTAKLGDLGFAFVNGRPADFDDRLIGEPAYVAPEHLYASQDSAPAVTQRQAADMYMLGGLVCFLLTEVPYSSLLMQTLDRALRPTLWPGSFEEVLPALIDGHVSAVESLRNALDCRVAEDIGAVVWELCHPDPCERGDIKARGMGQNPYGLTRYITRLNRIHRKALLAERKTA